MFNRLRHRYIATVTGLIMAAVLALSVALLAEIRPALEQLTMAGPRAMADDLLRVTQERGEGMIRLAALALAEPLAAGDLSTVFDLLHELRAQRGVELAFVFDSDGVVVQDGGNTLPPRRIALDDAESLAALGESDRVLVWQQGEHMYLTRPIRHGGESLGGLQLALPLEWIANGTGTLKAELDALADAAVSGAVETAILTTLGLMVVGVAFAVGGAERMAGPLRELARTASRLGRGEYRVRVATGRRDEIGEVRQAFNQMGQNLEDAVVPRRFMENLIDTMHDSLVVIDADDRVHMANRVAQELFVTRCCRLLGSRFSELFPDKHRASIEAAVASARHTRDTVETDAECDGTDGGRIPVAVSCSLLPNDGADVVNLVCIVRDLSKHRKAESHIRFLAQYDLLTGLPNRALFQDRLTHALDRGERNQRMVGLMLLDLDGFTLVNDTLGHKVGDKLLQQVAERLRTNLRRGDTVARLEDDAFIVVAELLKTAEDCSRLVDGLLAALNEPFHIDGRELFITGSAGVTLYPLAAEDAPSLLRQTDIAMNRAKEEGKNRWRLYERGMVLVGSKRLELESELRNAIQQGRFELYYQPILETIGRRIVAVEALLRWQHPDAGTLASDDFLPLLEDMGLMASVNNWVLNSACTQAGDWRRLGLPPVRMVVKLPVRQFDVGDVAAEIFGILQRLGLPGTGLELDITETALIRDPRRLINALKTLKDQGVRVVIDDFGAGFSSFGFFQLFDVNAVKVKLALVQQATGNQDHHTIVRALIGSARALEKQVVLEGVDTEAQLEFAREQKVELVQGQRLGRPLSAAEMQVVLQAEAQSTRVGANSS